MTPVAPADLHVLDESALRGLLVQVDRHRNSSRLLVVTAAPRWHGPEVLETDGGPVRVVAGQSVLAVRAAMAEHPDEFLAVLTPLPLRELGEEVLARAWHQHAYLPSPWDAVKALFKVDQLDPALRKERWMVDLLVRVAPARGYLQPASQLLDRETAWHTVLRFGLALPMEQPRTTDLLAWAATPSAAAALARLDPADLDRIAEHLAVAVGPGAVPLLRLAAAGRGADVLALGLVVDALWPDCDVGARMLLQERQLDRRPLDDAAAADWGSAAVAVVRGDHADGVDDHDLLQRVDMLLAEVDPSRTADSAVIGRAFPQRLARLGKALTAVLDDGTPRLLPAAVTALAAVKAHLLAGREAGRVSRAGAALRLCRRATSAQQDGGRKPSNLAALAARYISDGAWVDAARHRIAEGESLPELVEVFDRLLVTLDEERLARDRRFAAAVAEEGVGVGGVADLSSSRALPIERVLDSVVAPVARAEPVLLLVIDGLSHAAAIPLLADLRREGWLPHGPDGVDLPPVTAALPSVTVVSRASLLSGRLQTGGQDTERDGFTSHAALLDAAAGQVPVLFHKADLKTQDGAIAPVVRDTLADPGHRVVGVVVNGVDDHLDRGAQLQLADGLEGVPILRPLLQAAAEARRVVVLASDHGHVLGSRQRVVQAPGGGERFRLAGGPAVPGEMEVAGARVLRGDHRVVAAADDSVRYIAVAKHGYHGGVTPAEVLCPLVVLVPGGVELPGWEPLSPRPPAWWDPSAAPLQMDVASPATPVPTPPAKRADPQLSLLDPPAEPAVPANEVAPAWLAALLTSPRLADQRRLAGRIALDDHDLGLLLRILVTAGGTASGAALQRTLGLPASRLRGKLGAARTLLDVDGYPVLRIEPDGTAALNLELLARQFQIPVPPAQAVT